MKYKVGDTVLVQGKVTQLDIRDYSLCIEFEGELSAWFGEHEIFKLPKAEKTYEHGLQDAWELVRKLYYGGISVTEIRKIYDIEESVRNKFGEVLRKYTPQEALAKLKAYEEESKIKVGDVVEHLGTSGVIIDFVDSTDDEMIVLNENGCVETWKHSHFAKTGKHIDIAGLLEQIKGE